MDAGEGVDFFDNPEALVDKGEAVANVEKEDLNVLKADVKFVEAFMKKQGRCHSSLAEASEVRYLMHAANFVHMQVMEMRRVQEALREEERKNIRKGLGKGEVERDG